MEKHSKIYIAGHLGLAGSAIFRLLLREGYSHLIYRTSRELDLRDQQAVDLFFKAERPDYVFLAAARVGGIYANLTYPATLIRDNLLIQASVLYSAFHYGVQKVIFLASSSVYPKDSARPIKEESFLTGVLEKANEFYAMAKIAGIEMCKAYNQAGKTQFICAVPTNLYGINDNFDLQTSHVVAALIRKFNEAKKESAPAVTIWGNGNQRRELLFADDLAEACLFLMENCNETELINVGTGLDIAILELAELIKNTVGYAGKIICDPSKPVGNSGNYLDVSKLTSLGWKAPTPLAEGIRRTYAWFEANQDQVRMIHYS